MHKFISIWSFYLSATFFILCLYYCVVSVTLVSIIVQLLFNLILCQLLAQHARNTLAYSYDHIIAKISKANKGIGIVKRLLNTLLRNCLLTIYKSVIRPHLDYCGWSNQCSVYRIHNPVKLKLLIYLIETWS